MHDVLTEVELPSGLALSRWCRQSCPALHQEMGAGGSTWPMFGDVSMCDELSAGSQSLAEHFESSRWLGQVAGLEKLRLKLNSTPLPHFPCCSSACTSWPLHVVRPFLPWSQEHLCWSKWLLLWSREAAWEPLVCALWGECCSPCSSGLLHLFWPFRSMGSNSSILLCMQQVYFSVASNLVNFMCDPNRPHWVRGCSMVVMRAGGLTAESAGCRF